MRRGMKPPKGAPGVPGKAAFGRGSDKKRAGGEGRGA
jgi:hypothetical protein